MIVNISDVYSNHRINQICDPMNDFISSLPNSQYEVTIGLRMALIPNSFSVTIRNFQSLLKQYLCAASHFA